MAKKKVCVSFDYENDGHLKRTLEMWNANKNIDFSFDDKTPKEIKSEDYSVVKGVLTRKISDATYLLAIVGKDSSKKAKDSDKIGDINWMNWEINKAKSLKKKLVAVKIASTYVAPEALYNSGASWAYSFTLDSIVNALNSK